MRKQTIRERDINIKQKQGAIELSYKTGCSYVTSNKTHQHDTYEMYFLISGAKTYEVEGEVYMLRPGDVMIIPPKVNHRTINSEEDYSGRVNASERIVVLFDELFLRPIEAFTYDYDLVSELLCQPRFISLSNANRTDLDITLSVIKNEISKAGDEYFVMARALMVQVFVYLHRQLNEDMAMPSASYKNIAQDILEYIDGNFTDFVSLNSLSRGFYMNPSALARAFKKHTGQTVSEYVNIRRVELAKQLLDDDSSSVNDIAMSVGFNNLTYFTRVFKRLTGNSPSQYRKLLGRSK